MAVVMVAIDAAVVWVDMIPFRRRGSFAGFARTLVHPLEHYLCPLSLSARANRPSDRLSDFGMVGPDQPDACLFHAFYGDLTERA